MLRRTGTLTGRVVFVFQTIQIIQIAFVAASFVVNGVNESLNGFQALLR